MLCAIRSSYLLNYPDIDVQSQDDKYPAPADTSDSSHIKDGFVEPETWVSNEEVLLRVINI